MAETTLTPAQTPRRFRLDWIPGILFMPRRTMEKIAAQNQGVWILPILLLSLTALAVSLIAGNIREIAITVGPELPPNFEYLSPADQAQYLQAAQAAQRPEFAYVFPGLVAISSVWFGWLLVGGLLHLLLTLLGGRGSTGTTMNLVAWCAIPFALRDIVRAVDMLITNKLIEAQGVSGFFLAGESPLSIFINKFLTRIDIYLIWHILLLVLGVRIATHLSLIKSWVGVLITILVVIGLLGLIGLSSSLLGGMTITRPYFF